MAAGVYVVNILVTGTSTAVVKQFFDVIQCLSIKNLGPVAKFPVMLVNQTASASYVSDQEEAIFDLLGDHGLSDAHILRVRQLEKTCSRCKMLTANYSTPTTQANTRR